MMMSMTTLTLSGVSLGLGFLGASRGDGVVAPGGAEGRYVGRRRGLDWVCYGDGAQFEAICKAFDDVWAASLEVAGKA